MKAAEQGYDVAQFNVGCCYTNSIGVEQDEAKAFSRRLRNKDMLKLNVGWNSMRRRKVENCRINYSDFSMAPFLTNNDYDLSLFHFYCCLSSQSRHFYVSKI
jgi:hypothetical protein